MRRLMKVSHEQTRKDTKEILCNHRFTRMNTDFIKQKKRYKISFSSSTICIYLRKSAANLSSLFVFFRVCSRQKNMDARERTKEIAAEFIKKGDALGWFDTLYREAEGNNERIPWADLEPNRFLRRWAKKTNLRGNGRKALVVGCGLGDDARFLHDLSFDVTAFDISPTAVGWAKILHAETDIHFQTADLFDAPKKWRRAFEFVLEVYTIQPLPLDLREKVIDSIADFVAEDGKLVVVTRGREDNEIPLELPWALSRKDLSRFGKNGLKQIHFEEMLGDEDEQLKRFVIEYRR